MSIESKYIWMDGKLVPYDQATVHFLTSGFHYGIGVFEGIRCYQTERGPAIFRLREHMHRLIASAHILGFKNLAYSESDLSAAAIELVRANQFSACYIRPLIYLSNPKMNLSIDSGIAKIGIACWEWGNIYGDHIQKGVRANISSFTRLHPNIAMTKAKISGNYVNSVLAKTESERLGFDEAILLDPQGNVAECTGENLFIVRNNVIYTTPLASILEGITRDTLIILAGDFGIPVHEKLFGRDMLYTADEVFVCGTAAEVVAVCEIDFRPIASGTIGPITHSLQSAFHQVVNGLHPRSGEWLQHVYAD
ncbi:MAG: branched-chain amino acid transaminase [Chloroflexota bacterium]|jgi:branched-chain amino acid aminotransferase